MASAAPATRVPARHVAVLAILAAGYVGAAAYSIMHLDLARDIAQGLAIARGERLPLEGPVLASTVHMGPLWYYVLALPVALSRSWLGVACFVAALAALKFPLAYALGTRVAGRRAGLVWALLLAYPGWTTFEPLLQNHASLVAACTLALLLALAIYLGEGTRRHAALAGLAYGVALHAHPSTIGLGVVVAAAIALCRRRPPAQRIGDACAAALAAAVPFAPYVVDQLARGLPDVDRTARFLGDPGLVGSAANLPRLAWALLFGGGEVVARDFVADARWPVALLWLISVLVLLCALAGAASLWPRREARRTLAALLAATLAVALAVALVRAATPFYMTFVVWTLAAGLLAIGIAGALGAQPLRWPALGVVLLAAVASVTVQASAVNTIRRGDFPLAFLPLFDVKTPYVRGEPMAFLPARWASASARVLCAADAIGAHGLYAVHLLHVYADEARLACARTSQIRLGGSDARPRLAGLSRATASVLAVDAAHRLGPLVLAPVARVVNRAFDAAVPDPMAYPPVAPATGPARAHVLEFVTDADEAVIVTDAYFAFTEPPRLAAAAMGHPLAPLRVERASTTFVCAHCARGVPVQWRLVVTTPAIERVDVVTVRARGRRA